MDVAALLRERIRDVPDFPRPGILFKDVAPVLADPAAFTAIVDAIVAATRAAYTVDKVVGIEARGFIVAAPVAYHLGAGFVPVRKAGKLPYATHSRTYDLEYGTATLEVHTDAFAPGERVLVVDDVLATGGTVEATRWLVEQAGAEVVGCSVVVELGALGGRERLAGLEVRSLLVV